MKSNHRKVLFLIIWLLFFILLIAREFHSSWIPESIKTSMVERQLNSDLNVANEIISEVLESKDPLDELLHFTDNHIPLFLFRGDELVFWNNDEIRPPASVGRVNEGLEIRDNGFSRAIQICKRADNAYTVIAYLPLWKNVGIQNQWLEEGSNKRYSYSWEISESNICKNEIRIRDDSVFNICFQDKIISENRSGSGLHFTLLALFLIGLALSYKSIEDALKSAKTSEIKLLSNTALILFFGLILFEYLRRFIYDPSPHSVFFVIYPYLLTFLLALYLLKPDLRINSRFGWLIVPLLMLSIYAFSKSYWIEIYDKEKFDLNLINFVRLEWKTIDAYLGLFGMSIFYFIATSFLIRRSNKADLNSGKEIIFAFILGISAFILEGIINSEWYLAYLLIAVLYAVFGTSRGFVIKKKEARGVGYYLVFIFLLSFFITETSNYGNILKQKESMLAFANKSIKTRSEIEKKLLAESAVEIAKDKFIHIAFSNPLTSREIIKQKIKKVYLDSYFDPFEIRIDFLDAKGDNLNLQSGYRNLFFFRSNFLKPEARVSEGVYFSKSEENEKSNDYFIHVRLTNSDVLEGHIIIEVYRDITSPNSIFPKLLVDEKYNELLENKYDVSELEMKSAELAGLTDLIGKERADKVNSFAEGQYDFFKVDDNSVLIINLGNKFLLIKDRISASPLLSSFSIVFMVISFLAIMSYLLIRNLEFRLAELPFRRKIQFFINLAFLLPLTVVSLSVLKFMNDNDRENIESNYLEKVNAISGGIEIPFLDYKNGLIPKRVFLERASKAAGLFSLDFFIYDKDGKLNTSSKEILWERGITNRLIDPVALKEMVLKDRDNLILEKHIDRFQYRTVFAKLQDLNGREIGILGVPFYESGEELEARFIQLLSTVINIFVLSFIVFLIFSNRLTDWLMVPVLRLTDKIRITSFETKNEPLEWSSNDEIGKLVDSYNNMIDKLNESRDALARTEKEAAWREMAQQVAHEIKNPLTPMRLRLQQLIRKSSEESGETDKLKETLNSMLHQVDALSEIATSFSEFARMPNPKNQRVKLNEIVHLASDIYKGKRNIELEIESPENELFVEADENMLSRSLGNIILNGIQSVDEDKSPRIKISLTETEGHAEIRVSDNGHGIDDELKDRIFIPHFSTKSSGTGIGLALAKKTVEGAKGSIRFESSAEGTIFIIRIPLMND